MRLAPDAQMATAAPDRASTIDGDRLLAHVAELACIGRTPDGGVTRLAFSPADVDGRTLVATWMRAAGLDVHVDAACNLVGRASAVAGPRLLLGSHIDTVVDAGALDGCYGVLAAIEVVQALRMDEIGGVSVIAFANEEGASGEAPFTGSRTIAGDPPLHTTALAAVLDGAGGDASRLEAAAWSAEEIGTFLELHIEQGPVLASGGRRIAAVTAITGQRVLEVGITGSPNHAGTTPMDHRRDALTAAARVVLAVETLARDGVVRAATVGRIAVQPNVRNVVPGEVELSVDVRDVDPGRLDGGVQALRAIIRGIAEDTGTAIEVSQLSFTEPVHSTAGLVDEVVAAAGELGVEAVRLPSGAGHDAQILGTVVPMAMIFVPSVGGVSHSPVEHTDPADLVLGAEVLYGTVRRVLRATAPPTDPATAPPTDPGDVR